MLKVKTLCLLLVSIVLMGTVSFAQESTNNQISLSGGVEISLPAWPSDPEHIKQFAELSLQEQQSFYFKRKILIEKIASGVAKPGVGRALRWTKRQITTTIGAVRSRFSPAQIAMGEGAEDLSSQNKDSVITFDELPANMSEPTKIFVESTVTALVNNFWANSVGIARSSSLGLTFVVGAIWNTTLTKWGMVAGRSLSVDVGIDFSNQSGYMNFYYDKQTLARGGFSIDVGLMLDVLLHVTDGDVQGLSERDVQHEKLPMIGCFRHGPSYIAWGGQLGLHVVEMAGLVATAFGHPEVGLAVIPAMRALGMATIYKTDLKRTLLSSFSFSKDHQLMKILGLSRAQKMHERATAAGGEPVLQCSQIFLASSF